MLSTWLLYACSTILFYSVYCNRAPTLSSIQRRDIDVTATAQIEIDDDGNEVPHKRNHHPYIKPTQPMSVHRHVIQKKHKRRKKKTNKNHRKSSRRSNIYRKSYVFFNSKRSLPLENPHPKEPTLQGGENPPPAIPDLQESNLNVDFNSDNSDLIGKSEVGTSAETSNNNTSQARPKTEDDENDEEEMDDIKPTDSPDDDDVPPTTVTDFNDDASETEGSGGDIDDDVKESMEEPGEEDPGDTELDTDEDEDEEADDTSPTADPTSEKKAIINGNTTIIEPVLVNKSSSIENKENAVKIHADTNAAVTNNTINFNSNATHPAEITRIENMPSDKVNITSPSDAEKDFAKLQKLEQDINRIAGDLQIKRNEILKRISMKKKIQNITHT